MPAGPSPSGTTAPPSPAPPSSTELQPLPLAAHNGPAYPAQPSRGFHLASSFTLGIVGAVCRAAMFGGQKTEVHGLQEFLGLLDRRRDVEGRERGLITVSNHLSIIDDPFMWGALPLRYSSNADNMRWSLGSFDLCFRNKPLSTFFTLGQVLPTHRQKYSDYGGPFQATMVQAIRLLSNPSSSYHSDQNYLSEKSESSAFSHLTDPFSGAHLTYSTNGTDTYPAPSAYLSRKHAWIHVFPEGRIHQHPEYAMRYFRWGVARLVLEADECPDIVPIWIEGCDQIMHEERTFPRFLPRLGRRVGIWFGTNVAGAQPDTVFIDLRRRWQELVRRDGQRRTNGAALELGVLSDDLKYGREAVELRKECTMAVRKAVLKLRGDRGLPDEDPKASLVETWLEEGSRSESQGRMRDGSIVREE